MSSSELWIMTVPVISTGHLTSATRQELDETLNSDRVFDNIYTVTFDAGWMFYNTEDPDFLDGDVSPDLLNILRWAYERDYEWVRVDANADPVEDLPYYED